MQTHYLAPLFAPHSLALVGASERAGSLGRFTLENLLAGGFDGKLLAINPKYQQVMGVPCRPSLRAIGSPVDLVVVVTPAASVAGILEDAGRAGIRHALVLSAGFAEAGPVGKQLEADVIAIARRHGIRMLGPNCLGIMRPSIGLNASFALMKARPGPVALVSQSGAVATALVDWADAAGIGFSSVISMGSGADLDFGEILDYLTHDAQTRSILLYIEGVREARRFLSGLRAAARTKPIIALKVGRHLSGSKAAMSHTGALAGNDMVFDAALARCGVTRVKTYAELFAAADLIGAGRFTRGNRLAIVTNGGGPGVMAADAAPDAGASLASLSAQTITALDALLPPHWSHGNPVDVLGDAPAERFAQALQQVMADDAADAILTLFCPQRFLAAEAAAQAIVECAARTNKPLLTAWLGETGVRDGRQLAERAGLPAFQSPEAAVAAFGALCQYHKAQQLLLQAPPPRLSADKPDHVLAQSIAEHAVAEARTLLTEPEAKQLLACFGIAAPRAVIARTAEETLAAARNLGFPLALKILSPDIAHKSDVKGVRLAIRDEESLLAEYRSILAQVAAARPDARIEGVVVQPMIEKRFGRELLLGVATDPVFGRIISFGAGGVAVELLRDHAVALPPLNRRLAEELISQTHAARLLGPYRHIPGIDMEALLATIQRVSEMVCSLPWLAEMDINPLLADASGCIALDARVVIDPGRMEWDPHFAQLAIHPYPARLEAIEHLSGCEPLRIRPIRPEDAQIELEFFEALSEQSRYMRFFSQMRQLTPALLARLTQVDYDRELALIALPANDEHMVGVARYTPNPDGTSCDFALTVADAWHGRGVGTMLMNRLMQAAREAGYVRMTGSVLSANREMLALVRALGFELQVDPDYAAVTEISRSLT